MLKGRLAGEYSMDPKIGMQPCGISACQTNHLNGWVVELEDETLGNVGRVCGKKHFANEWARMRKDYGAAKKAQAQIEARKVAIERLLAVSSERDFMTETGVTRARALLAAFDGLPDNLRATLISRAQSNDNVVTERRLQTAGEVFADPNNQGKAKPTPRLIDAECGRIRGLSALAPPRRIDYILDCKLPEMRMQASRLVGDQSTKTEDFSALERAFRSVQSQAKSGLMQIEQFFDQSNLNLLVRLQPAEAMGLLRLIFEDGASPTLRLEFRLSRAGTV